MAPLRKRLLRITWIVVFGLLVLVHVLILKRLCEWFAEELDKELHNTVLPPPASYRKQTSHARFSVDLPKSHHHRTGGRASRSRAKDVLQEPLSKKRRTHHNQSTFLASFPNVTRQMLLAEEAKHRLRQEKKLPALPDDKVSLLKLREQGIEVPPEEWDDIPDWSTIQNAFGEEPVVLGMERCQAYRDAVPPQNRSVAPAGNFNTGTNLFSVFFNHNCQGLAQKPLLQVPWGKHNLGMARIDDYQINKTRYQEFKNDWILPVVLVRHPISWMFSTCKHSYAAHWNHTKENCPHLVREEIPLHRNQQTKYLPRAMYKVHVAYGYKRTDRKYHLHSSLVHFWKEWIESFTAPDFPFPRLIVRLEDIVYQPLKVLSKICQCAGGKQRPGGKIAMPEESVKVKRDRMRNKTGLPGSLVRGNASDTAGLLKAWKDHASIPKLWERMAAKDQRLVRQVLMTEEESSSILDLLHYKMEGQ